MKLILSQNNIIRGIVELKDFTTNDRIDTNFMETIPNTLTIDGTWIISKIDESKEMTEENTQFIKEDI